MTQPTEHYALAQLLLAAVFSPGPHFVVHLLVLIFMMNIQLLGGSASRTRTMRLDPRRSNPLHPSPLIRPLLLFIFIGHFRTSVLQWWTRSDSNGGPVESGAHFVTCVVALRSRRAPRDCAPRVRAASRCLPSNRCLLVSNCAGPESYEHLSGTTFPKPPPGATEQPSSGRG